MASALDYIRECLPVGNVPEKTMVNFLCLAALPTMDREENAANLGIVMEAVASDDLRTIRWVREVVQRLPAGLTNVPLHLVDFGAQVGLGLGDKFRAMEEIFKGLVPKLKEWLEQAPTDFSSLAFDPVTPGTMPPSVWVAQLRRGFLALGDTPTAVAKALSPVLRFRSFKELVTKEGLTPAEALVLWPALGHPMDKAVQVESSTDEDRLLIRKVIRDRAIPSPFRLPLFHATLVLGLWDDKGAEDLAERLGIGIWSGDYIAMDPSGDVKVRPAYRGGGYRHAERAIHVFRVESGRSVCGLSFRDPSVGGRTYQEGRLIYQPFTLARAKDNGLAIVCEHCRTALLR